jgi:hypothetical protein
MVNQATPHVRPNGDTIFPPFEMIDTYGGTGNASAFLAATVVGDILGWDSEWDGVSRGTFTTPDGRVIVFENGNATVTVNGVPMQMTNTQGTAIPARISTANNRFIVPIRFFVELGVNVQWIGGTPGNFSMMVGN